MCYAVSLTRPFFLLLATVLFPFTERFRAKNPCFLDRFLFLGLNVFDIPFFYPYTLERKQKKVNSLSMGDMPYTACPQFINTREMFRFADGVV